MKAHEVDDLLRLQVEVAARELSIAALELKRIATALPRRRRAIAVHLESVAHRLEVACDALSVEVMVGPEPQTVRGIASFARIATKIGAAGLLALTAGLGEGVGQSLMAEYRHETRTAESAIAEVDLTAARLEGSGPSVLFVGDGSDIDDTGQEESGHQEGFSGKSAAEIAGVSYRQLDYWARTDLVRPTLSDARGSGSRRLYSFDDLVTIKSIKELLDAGVKLETVRKAVPLLSQSSSSDWCLSIGASQISVVDGRDTVRSVSEGAGPLTLLYGADIRRELLHDLPNATGRPRRLDSFETSGN